MRLLYILVISGILLLHILFSFPHLQLDGIELLNEPIPIGEFLLVVLEVLLVLVIEHGLEIKALPLHHLILVGYLLVGVLDIHLDGVIAVNYILLDVLELHILGHDDPFKLLDCQCQLLYLLDEYL